MKVQKAVNYGEISEFGVEIGIEFGFEVEFEFAFVVVLTEFGFEFGLVDFLVVVEFLVVLL